jgi:hypothetical protein
MRMIAIDPGISCCGVAEFEGSYLQRAALVANPTRSKVPIDRVYWMADEVSRLFQGKWGELVIERPQMGTYGPARQKDLVLLCEVGACLAGMRRLVPVSVTPHQWKGSIDAELMVERVHGRLSQEETEKVALPSAKSKGHNVWDAIGVGLWYFGRLERHREIAR